MVRKPVRTGAFRETAPLAGAPLPGAARTTEAHQRRELVCCARASSRLSAQQPVSITGLLSSVWGGTLRLLKGKKHGDQTRWDSPKCMLWATRLPYFSSERYFSQRKPWCLPQCRQEAAGVCKPVCTN